MGLSQFDSFIMAIGKNKRLSKGGKKGRGKKVIDPMTRKEWYNIKAPNLFKIREVGKTPVNRSQGTYIASDALMGRVFVANLGDLNEDEDQSHRKIRLLCEDVQGRDVLTSFQGMVFTTDKLKSLIKKWHTLIEANADIKTSQIKQIRAKMIEVMEREVSGGDLKEFVTKLIPELIRKEIEKATRSIFPLQNVYIRKVKVLKRPKFDVGKLLDLHTISAEDRGRAMAAQQDAAKASDDA